MPLSSCALMLPNAATRVFLRCSRTRLIKRDPIKPLNSVRPLAAETGNDALPGVGDYNPFCWAAHADRRHRSHSHVPQRLTRFIPAGRHLGRLIFIYPAGG